MQEWQDEAERLKFDEGKSWAHVTEAVRHYFPELTDRQALEKVRITLRRSPRYHQIQDEDFHRSSMEYKADGSIVSEKFITLRDGEDMTPDFILTAHGLDVSRWKVVSYKNNFWNTQISGGGKQISYQSKLTARPKVGGVDAASVMAFYEKLDRKGAPPVKCVERKGSMMAEVNIADLHLGKLCWHGDTPENYDHKIAQELFYRIIGEIANQLSTMPIERILFVWANDFFNSDNEEKTTTGGTPQDTDIRNKKMFNIGWEMLVRAIETFKLIAPVETFYTPSNHDEETAYHALGVLNAWFRNDENVSVNMDAYPRKYILYGSTLLGFTHGDKENNKGTSVKASKLASLMPIEARQLWGQARFYEMHAAHLHSEQMIQEINGVIVRRISSPTALDSWHVTGGYMGAVRKAQTFVYDKERGLEHIINTPV
jgi:hypothetical protein